MQKAAPKPSPYIVSPKADLFLIIGAVVLCPAILLPMAELSSPYMVWLVVMTFGAVGHHLPSFLRTYGDRELFMRYRTRLIVAPVLFFAATLGFALNNLHGMLLISLCWSIWHGMMQHFGFLRIYDSKVHAHSPMTARLDYWLTVSWFGLCLVFSPAQGSSLLSALYDAGIPIIPPSWMGGTQTLFLVSTTILTLAYIYNSLRTKEPRSWLKLGLLVGTFVYVYIVRVLTKDPFLSVALFELLHDVQYLAIVWAFNRRQVEKGSKGVLPRAFYLPKVASVGAYIGACLLYGLLALGVYTQMSDGLFKHIMEAFLITSGLLHFYYDGFIWKLRQPEIRSGLNIDTTENAPTRRAYRAGLIQASIVCVAVVVLAALETTAGQKDPFEKEMAIVQAVPESSAALNNVGVQLTQSGLYEEALPYFRKALRIQPGLDDARTALSDTLAIVAQQKAQAGLGNVALINLREAIRIEPESAERHNDLGALLAQMGDYDEAYFMLRQALVLDPNHQAARDNLARIEPYR